MCIIIPKRFFFWISSVQCTSLSRSWWREWEVGPSEWRVSMYPTQSPSIQLEWPCIQLGTTVQSEWRVTSDDSSNSAQLFKVQASDLVSIRFDNYIMSDHGSKFFKASEYCSAEMFISVFGLGEEWRMSGWEKIIHSALTTAHVGNLT